MPSNRGFSPLPKPTRSRAERLAAANDEPVVNLTDGISISTDGSASPETKTAAAKSGWGFDLFGLQLVHGRDFYGPCILNPADPLFLGSQKHSNNVGELSAITHALRWALRHLRQGTKVRMSYDSKFITLRGGGYKDRPKRWAPVPTLLLYRVIRS